MPDTPAIAALGSSGLAFRIVETERAFSVEEAAEKQGVPVANLLKTLVARRGEGEYLFVVLPGDRAIDWPKLRAHLGLNRMTMPDADEAFAATGYVRGTITPFGASTPWPVIADATMRGAGVVSFGAGEHGVAIHIDADAALAHLDADFAEISKAK